MMRILLLFLYSLSFALAEAQPLRNEWIDHSKTYYRIPVLNEGLHRIPKSTLDAAGLGTVPAEQFQLWRNGEEVPLYTSQPQGQIATGGFIEFYGKPNDGETDKELYLNPDFHVQKLISLFTDTAMHYLTVNPGGNNKRLVNTANNVNSTILPADSFFMHSIIGNPWQVFLNGLARGVQTEPTGQLFTNLYSSAWDMGEGMASSGFRLDYPYNINLTGLRLFAGGPAMSLAYSVSGGYHMTRNVIVRLNDSLLNQDPLADYNLASRQVVNIPLSRITNDATRLTFTSETDYWQEASYLHAYQFNYPRRFDQINSRFLRIQLAASTQGNHLRIQRFLFDNQPALVYDLTNLRRYTAVSKGDSTLVLLEPSATDRTLLLLNQSTTQIRSVTTLPQVVFRNFKNPDFQSDYIIISNRRIAMANGVDQIEEYRKYRSSAEGGSYNAKVYEVDELAEQFAYGMRRNPLAIRNFLRLAIDSFATKPKHVLLLGHASEYINYRFSLGQASAEILNAVPTWGNPGSDNLFASKDYMNPVPRVPIGRVSAMNGIEIKNYLDKVKMFESLKRSAGPLTSDKEWQKQAVHLIGGDDPFTSLVVNNFVSAYSQIISDTPIKANVIQRARTNNPTYAQDIATIKQRLDSGVALLTYFGHSSASSIDFNLNSPAGIANKDGKFPVFIANGCLAGNIFRHDGNRFNTTNVSISENFVLSPNSGSIAFISNSFLGPLNYLNLITRNWYQAYAKTRYGKTLGEIQQEGLRAAFAVTGPTDAWNKWMNEQNVLHGDPAIVPFPNQVPDFATDNNQISLVPQRPGIDLDSLRVKLRIYNLGASRNDSVRIEVRRELPNGGFQPIAEVIGRNVNNADSIWFSVPLKGMFETGTSAIVATLDPWNEQDELNESNNTARLEFDLASLEIRPVYPYNFAIVKSAPTRFTGSTINAADDLRRYVFQIDTTEQFNSPLLRTLETESLGGAVNFFPTVSWTAGRVYYWRVSPLVGGVPLLWRNASFVYMPGTETGFNQSHYYQHRYSLTQESSLDSTTREFGFGTNLQNLYINHGIYSSSGQEDSHFSVSVNGLMSIRSACLGSSIIFNVFDPITFKPWANDPGGLYGSAMNNCNWYRQNNFEFGYYPASNRKKIMDFLDIIPKGHIVAARLVVDPPYDSLLIQYWKRDTLVFGSGKSLYHSFKSQGLGMIDSLYRARTFGFIFRKDDTLSSAAAQQVSEGFYDRVSLSENLTTIDTAGQLTSPKLGPAAAWKQLLWQGDHYNNNPVGKSMKLELWGIKNTGNAEKLRSYDHGQFSDDISGIAAQQYPFLQMRLNSADPATAKAYQLNYWRLYYQPVADGALSARDHFVFEDTVNALTGTVRLEIAFRNVSDQPLQSVQARIVLGDEFGNEMVYPLGKLKQLLPGDTTILRLVRPALGLGGRYYLKVETNYDKAVQEQEWFNNSVIIPLYVGAPSLPVSLVDFAATKQGKQALLNWHTKTEAGVVRYTVEQSTSGGDWKTVGSMAPQNNAQDVNTYQLVHAYPARGTNFYRLKITETNGNTVWSAIRKLHFDGANVSIFPNPFADFLSISSPGNWQVELYDAAGKLLMRQNGSGIQRLQTRNLQAGSYLVRFSDNSGHTESYKLQKH